MDAFGRSWLILTRTKWTDVTFPVPRTLQFQVLRLSPALLILSQSRLRCPTATSLSPHFSGVGLWWACVSLSRFQGLYCWKKVIVKQQQQQQQQQQQKSILNSLSCYTQWYCFWPLEELQPTNLGYKAYHLVGRILSTENTWDLQGFFSCEKAIQNEIGTCYSKWRVAKMNKERLKFHDIQGC